MTARAATAASDDPTGIVARIPFVTKARQTSARQRIRIQGLQT